MKINPGNQLISFNRDEIKFKDYNKRFYVYVYVELSEEILFDYDNDLRQYSFMLEDGYPIIMVGKPFYIGKGSGLRILSHLNDDFKHNRFKKETFERILNNDDLIHYYLLRRNLTETEAYDLENKLIWHYGTQYDNTGILANINKRKGKPINYVYHTPWNKGLTKETSEKVRLIAEKCSLVKKLNPPKSPMKGKKHPNPTSFHREDHPKWIEFEINLFIEKYFMNISCEEIGNYFNCTRSATNRMIKDLKFPIANRRISGEKLRKQIFIKEFFSNQVIFYKKDNELKEDYFKRVHLIINKWNNEYDFKRRKEFKNGDFDIPEKI
jgi:hypothetical protein